MFDNLNHSEQTRKPSSDLRYKLTGFQTESHKQSMQNNLQLISVIEAFHFVLLWKALRHLCMQEHTNTHTHIQKNVFKLSFLFDSLTCIFSKMHCGGLSCCSSQWGFFLLILLSIFKTKHQNPKNRRILTRGPLMLRLIFYTMFTGIPRSESLLTLHSEPDGSPFTAWLIHYFSPLCYFCLCRTSVDQQIQEVLKHT